MEFNIRLIIVLIIYSLLIGGLWFIIGIFIGSDCPNTKYIVQPCECEENLMTAESCNQLDNLVIERYENQKERWKE